MKHVKEIVNELKKHYTTTFFADQHDRNPFKVLISCLISLRTKDEVTYPASQRLFKLAKTPEKMMKIKTKKIEKAIYPAGFYKTKAKRIKNISKVLVEEYNSKVPETINELVKLHGVGRKTANIVMVFAYNKPAIPVDTHVHKLSNRLGWLNTKNPDQTEQKLRKKLPKKYWLEINELFVRHGQEICKSISPWCSKCTIKKYCQQKGVERSR
ncbi:MAG: G/T mismatches repair enzyme [Candidatus Woesearchaeota archaeon]|nr:G/T mismatches repair enzyme [Candidatus Woesearchaeota archaeon]